MIEYPSIINSSKAPRGHCVAFDKLDGSNFRAKWTQKAGFSLFGTRTQLVDEDTKFWGEAVTYFKHNLAGNLSDKFKRDKDYRDYREIIVYGEFLGPNSFAGRHADEPKEVIVFDVMVGHKNRKFVRPTEFVRDFQEIVKIPDIIYVGNLNEEFINNVRQNIYGLKEGVICKGTIPSGAFCGGVWSCKIKTLEYLANLKKLYANDWEKFWE